MAKNRVLTLRPRLPEYRISPTSNYSEAVGECLTDALLYSLYATVVHGDAGAMAGEAVKARAIGRRAHW